MFGWYRRWSSRTKEQMKHIRELRDLVSKINDLRSLDENNIFRFPMLGEEVQLYLPYARFDYIQKHILADADFFEGDLLRHVRQTYFSGARCKVLDVGGNIGNHAVFFSKFCNAEVVSFEPQPAIFEILKKNIEMNAPDVVAYNLALGKTEGGATFKDYDSLNTGGTRISVTTSGPIKVCPLDSFDFKDVHFMKIDVEGFEGEVFKGAKRTILESKPIIWVEIFKENYSDIFEILNEFNYELREQLAASDYVFAPKDNHDR